MLKYPALVLGREIFAKLRLELGSKSLGTTDLVSTQSINTFERNSSSES